MENVAYPLSEYSIYTLERDIAALETELDSYMDTYVAIGDTNTMFLLLCTIFIFTFQLGLAFVEVGAVSPKNTKSVLIKNLLDCIIAAIAWWICGYAFAFGRDKGAIIGTSMFFTGNDVYSDGESGYTLAHFIWSWSFAATSSTIVSGSVAERCSITAYMLYSSAITALIYPLVAHWVWDSKGWASRNLDNPLFGCGALDMSGTCPVHFVGGLLALMAAIHTGPRRGRFTRLSNGEFPKMITQSPALNTMGTLFLWTGWLAFNGSAPGSLSGNAYAIANAMVNTALAASGAIVAALVYGEFYLNKADTFLLNNCGLTAMVAVTGCCAVIKAEAAFIIGIIATMLYLWGSKLMFRLRIDDVVDASVVHGIGGVWGTIATGFFTAPEQYGFSVSSDAEQKDRCCGLFYGCRGQQLAANFIFLCVTAAWVLFTGQIIFLGLKWIIGLRAQEEDDHHHSHHHQQHLHSLHNLLHHHNSKHHPSSGWAHAHQHHLSAVAASGVGMITAGMDGQPSGRVRYLMTLSRPKRTAVLSNPTHGGSGGGGDFGNGSNDGSNGTFGTTTRSTGALLQHSSTHQSLIGKSQGKAGYITAHRRSSESGGGSGGGGGGGATVRRGGSISRLIHSLSPTSSRPRAMAAPSSAPSIAGSTKSAPAARLYS